MADESAEMATRASQVDRALQTKKYAEALNLVLQPLPGEGKSNEVKEANLVLVEKLFTVTPDAEITKMVAALSLDSCDTLMKNVYKLMGKCKACSAMLK
eukprot:gene6544-8136_t